MDEVRVVMPAASEYLRVARLVAADAAARAGLDCEEVEDFRIAVDELCHSIMAATDHHLVLDFATLPDGVTARGTAPGRTASSPPRLTDLSASIVLSVCDHVEIDAVDGMVSFLVVKRAAHAPIGRR
jgi:hypothetical protein